eukprot:CAMPEP_0172518636 /NCGR_PEP_ID=MMETSP1066-20121228/290936_1 /TAXON_ID=671091 /ORGANISM="Coscinodiscus wailesii, Strain CCMP2513" /LENGTH=1283 /DNA_ID=CAMNT_0013301063 /DNA_START=107 /DNA_END=3958 /DNA_ORIENTATION=-
MTIPVMVSDRHLELDDVPLEAEINGNDTADTELSPPPSPTVARPTKFDIVAAVGSSIRSITSAVSEVLHLTPQGDTNGALTAPFLVNANQLSKLANERTRDALADLLEDAISSDKGGKFRAENPGAGIEMTKIKDSTTAEDDVESPNIEMKHRTLMTRLIKRLRRSQPPEGSKDEHIYFRDAEIAASTLTEYVLRSNAEAGLNPSAVGVEHRKTTFGQNAIADKKLDSFLKLCWDAMQDHVLILLIVLGIITIIMETTFALDPGESCGLCFLEGMAILVAVVIVVLVTASIDYAKQFAFIKLTRSLHATNTKVVTRGGEQINVTDDEIVVGDILSVNSHNLASIPADCVLLGPTSGSLLKMDESSLTGESKLISKRPGDVILSGTTANSGTGKMVVIAVGINSVAGKIKARVYESDTLNEEDDDFESEGKTPLFAKLDHIAHQIGLGGSVAAVISFLALFAKLDHIAHQIGLGGSVAAVISFLAMSIIGLAINGEPATKLVDYLVVAITVLAVAVPEGLPLAVTLSLAFSSNKMTKDMNLVKHLDACETMGSATTICTDKTGTLTANKMTVRAMYLASTNYICDNPSITLGQYVLSHTRRPSEDMISLITKVIAIATMNESNLVFSDNNDHVTSSSGNPTEVALLLLAHDLGVNYRDLRNETRGRASTGVLAEHYGEGRMIGFSSARKMMSWAVPLFKDGQIVGYRLYSKGAAEVMTARSSTVLTLEGEKALDGDGREVLADTAEKYARRGMRCIGLAYKDLPVDADFEAKHVEMRNSDGKEALSVETDMVFLGLVGIEDPLRKEVPGAISKCYEAGIDVRMVTGDSPNTAVSIAYQGGILKDFHFKHSDTDTVSELGVDGQENEKEMVASHLKDNILMEGKAFREKVYRTTEDGKQEFDQQAFDAIWPHLRVLARSSPDDKLTLAHGLNQSTLYTNKDTVRKLKKEDNIIIFPDRQVVAMTGDGTNDAPALKRADIGFAMGIAGTQIAKDAADIILLDDNFASIVTAAKWGRNVYASIQKFLQFQLTVNISAVTIALVGSFAYQQSPLAAIQLLWVNLLMDSLASLALASEPPIEELLQRPPVNRSDNIVTKRMFFNMTGQAAYQLIVIMVLLFEGPELLGMDPGHLVEKDGGLGDGWKKQNSRHYTLIFNAFVWMQLFNEVNCRNLRGEFRVFKGIHRNPLFVGILLGTAVVQVILVQYGEPVFHTAPGGLSGPDWVLCLVVGAFSLPIQQFLNVLYKFSKYKYKNLREKKRVAKDRELIYRAVPGGGSVGSAGERSNRTK